MTYVSTLEITTVSRCSVQCTYCPQDKLKDAYHGAHKMSLYAFERMLTTVPLDVRIHFSGMVEPWLNERCTDMLAHALGLGHRVAIYTTLQGMTDALDVTAMLRHYESLIDVVCVHMPDVHGNMRGHRITPEWEAAVDAFRELETARRIPYAFEWLSMGQPLIPIRRADWSPIDRAGSLDRTVVGEQPVMAPVHRDGPIACAYTDTYTHNVVLPNGDVVLCCMDYGLKHNLGNLLTQSYEEIVSGPEMHRIRTENAKQTGDTICRRCHGAKACAS